MKIKCFLFLIILYLVCPSKAFSQIDDLALYTAGAEFLLDKTNIDPTVIKMVEKILPKAVNRDVEGAVTELTTIIYEKKQIKALNPDFINYARNKITNLSGLFKEEDYFGITMGISDFILVTDDYIKKNVVPDKTFLNKNKVAETLVDTTSINKSVKAIKVNHKAIIDQLKSINDEGKKINCVSFTSFGGYVILYGTNGYYSYGIPANANAKLKELHDNGKHIKFMSFSPAGGYVILFDKNSWVTNSINPKVNESLTELNNKGSSIESVSFAPEGGYVIVFNKYGCISSKIPVKLYDKLTEINSKNIEIKNVSFEEGGGFIVNYGKNGYFSSELSTNAKEKLHDLNQNNKTIDFVSFITGGGYVMVYDNTGYSYRGEK